jgi:hypothetical protein
MIRIKKNGKIELLPQALHKSRNLGNSDKLAFAFRDTNQHRHVQFSRAIEYRVQLNRIGDVEVTDRHAILLRLLQGGS